MTTKLKTHNCGNFDASYVEIKDEGRGDGWVLWLGDDPECSIKFCPYCGANLEGELAAPRSAETDNLEWRPSHV